MPSRSFRLYASLIAFIFVSSLNWGLAQLPDGGQRLLVVLKQEYAELGFEPKVVGGAHGPYFYWNTEYADLNQCMDALEAYSVTQIEYRTFIVVAHDYLQNQACIASLPYLELCCPFTYSPEAEPWERGPSGCPDWCWVLAQDQFDSPYAAEREELEQKKNKASIGKHQADVQPSRAPTDLAKPLIRQLLNILHINTPFSYSYQGISLDDETALNAPQLISDIQRMIKQLDNPTEGQDVQRAFLLYFLGQLHGQSRPMLFQDYFREAQAYMAARLHDGRLFPLAAYALGKMYEQGRGLPQSFYLAHYYYSLAAEGNFPIAADRARRTAVSPDMAARQTARRLELPAMETAEEVVENCAGERQLIQVQRPTTPRAHFSFKEEDRSSAQACNVCLYGSQWVLTPGIYSDTPEVIKPVTRCEDGIETTDGYLVVIPSIAVPSLGRMETDWSKIPQEPVQDRTLYQGDESKLTPPGYAGSSLKDDFSYYFRKPEFAAQHSGLLQLSFVVRQDGQLADFVIQDEPAAGMGHEAIRVLAHLGPWRPASLRGAPVDCLYQFSIALE